MQDILSIFSTSIMRMKPISFCGCVDVVCRTDFFLNLLRVVEYEVNMTSLLETGFLRNKI